MTAEVLGRHSIPEMQPDLYSEQRSGGYIGLRHSIVRGIDGIYCVSDHGKSYMKSRYPFLADKLHTARLGAHEFIVPEKRLHLILDTIEYLIKENPWRKPICWRNNINIV
jgi:colanic acid/amylovoran biosynthesis glycosyltransferase